MNICKRISAAVLACMMLMTTAMTAHATEVETTEELTPEQQALQLELQQAYDIPVQSNEWKNWPQAVGTYGEAAIVMEVGTGTILYAKNIDTHQYPASITKVLTALVALENGQLTDPVTFSKDCVSFLKPGDSSVGLKEGNEITLEQALYATLLASANEAAYAVAENVGTNAGHDYDWFIEQMNVRCKELGGENSNFVNANGLHDENHYTCARDMALIGRELFKHPEFFQIVQTLNYEIPQTEMVEQHIFQQKHKMLKPNNANYYPYAIGGKTGYTSDALSTLITMADNEQMQLVCVVLRTHGKNVYPDTTNLFEYAFQNFRKVSISEHETSEDVKEIIPNESADYVILPNGVEFSSLETELVPDGEDSEFGTMIYTYDGHEVGNVRVTLSESYLKKQKKNNKDNKKVSKISEKDSDQKKSESEKQADESSLKQKILLGLVILLAVLVVAFIAAVVRVRRIRKKNRKKRKKERDQKTE